MTEDKIEFCEFWVSANRVVRSTGKPNFAEAKVQVNYKWDFDYLEEELKEYKDKEVLKFFKYGWELNATDTEEQGEVLRNQAGARINKEKVHNYLKGQHAARSILGPFKTNPLGKFACFLPLDTKKKKDNEELRVILNLSHPFHTDLSITALVRKVILGKYENSVPYRFNKNHQKKREESKDSEA